LRTSIASVPAQQATGRDEAVISMARHVLKQTPPMSLQAFGRLCVLAIALVLGRETTRASLIYTYDFPGPGPNNGLATNQTNGQPSNATFSDFTRNGGLTGTGNSDVFGSKNWPTGGTLDPNVFTAFTITADPGFVLTLSQLTFDSLKNGATAPLFAEVDLFLNGSSTAYASFAWIPQNSPMTSYTFNFTPVTAADNVTTATFRFYAWNATDATNEVQFDNVAVYGSIEVPEAAGLGPAALVISCAILLLRLQRRSQRRPASSWQ
jgi:hypothetical protein